jgi:uncharacterized phiE125 gp8 family phage protein
VGGRNARPLYEVIRVYKTITEAADEPVSIGDVKLHLRLTDDTTEDDLLYGLITAARVYCEKYTRRAFTARTLELLLKEFPSDCEIDLPCPPLTSVTSVKYKNSSGIESTLSTADYIVDSDGDIGKVVLAYGKAWPSFTAYPSNPIRVRFITGYSMLPQPLKQSMLLLIGHWYENREASLTGTTSKEIAFAVTSLLSQYRVGWWD